MLSMKQKLNPRSVLNIVETRAGAVNPRVLLCMLAKWMANRGDPLESMETESLFQYVAYADAMCTFARAIAETPLPDALDALHKCRATRMTSCDCSCVYAMHETVGNAAAPAVVWAAVHADGPALLLALRTADAIAASTRPSFVSTSYVTYAAALCMVMAAAPVYILPELLQCVWDIADALREKIAAVARSRGQ